MKDKELDSFLVNRKTVNILKSSGKSRSVEDFPILEYYLEDTDSHPRLRSYEKITIKEKLFVEEIQKIGGDIIFVKEEVLDNFQIRIESYYHRVCKGYFVEISSHLEESEKFDISALGDLNKLGHDNLVVTGYVSFYFPSINSELYSPELENVLHELVKKCQVKKNITDLRIGMICMGQHFYIKDFYITKEYNLLNPDLHYGQGFEVFHTKLLERFKVDSKGLVLLHGESGTGKTYYIRNLIKDLISLGKQVIYFPPNMVTHLVSPEIMSFLSDAVIEIAEEGKSCVLLLEDAEPLLISRTEGRSDGITNLLNITDGLLNDMLSIQVIATFNTEIKNIDSALLRPERLIARKEFKKLNKEDAQILVNTLGFDLVCNDSMTLADIYSQQNQRDVLVHDYSLFEKKSRIGF